MGISSSTKSRDDNESVIDYINTLKSVKYDYMTQNFDENPTSYVFCGCFRIRSLANSPTQYSCRRWKEYLIEELKSSDCGIWPKKLLEFLKNSKSLMYCNTYQQEILWMKLNYNIMRQPMTITFNKNILSNSRTSHSNSQFLDSSIELSSHYSEDFKEHEDLKASLNFPENSKVKVAIEDTMVLEERVLEAHDQASVLEQYFDITYKDIVPSGVNLKRRVSKKRSKTNVTPKMKAVDMNALKKMRLKLVQIKDDMILSKSNQKYLNNTLINETNMPKTIEEKRKEVEDDIFMNITDYKAITNVIEKHLNDDKNIFCQLIQKFINYFVEYYKIIIFTNGNDNNNPKDKDMMSFNSMGNNIIENLKASNIKIDEGKENNPIQLDKKVDNNNNNIADIKRLIDQGINDIYEFIRILYETLDIFYDFENLRRINVKKKMINNLYNQDNLYNFICSVFFKKSFVIKSSSINNISNINNDNYSSSLNSSLTGGYLVQSYNTMHNVISIIDVYGIVMKFIYMQEANYEADFKKALKNIAHYQPQEFGVHPKFCLNEITFKYLNDKYKKDTHSKSTIKLDKNQDIGNIDKIERDYCPGLDIANNCDGNANKLNITLKANQFHDKSIDSYDKQYESAQDHPSFILSSNANIAQISFQIKNSNETNDDQENISTIDNLDNCRILPNPRLKFTNNSCMMISDKDTKYIKNLKNPIMNDSISDIDNPIDNVNTPKNLIITEEDYYNANENNITPNFCSEIMANMLIENKEEEYKYPDEEKQKQQLLRQSQKQEYIQKGEQICQEELKDYRMKIKILSSSKNSFNNENVESSNPDFGIKSCQIIQNNKSNTNNNKDILPFSKAINILKTIDKYHSPIHKLKIISRVGEAICICIKEYYDAMGISEIDKLDGDQTLSIFMYLLSKTKLYTLPSECNFIMKFITPNIMNSISGYYTTTIQASIFGIMHIFNKPNNEI